MDWWVWLLVGLGLLLVEMVTPGGFYVLFFGLAALGVGVLTAIGVAGPLWIQWLLFSVGSVAGLLVLRRPLRDRLGLGTSSAVVDSLVGGIATATEAMAANGSGRVEFRGTSWTARNVGTRPLAPGERCRVRQVEGLTLLVRAE